MSAKSEIKLIDLVVSVEAGTEVERELLQVIAERLRYREAIRACLETAASGRIGTALEVLRKAYPAAAELVRQKYS